MKQHTCPVHGLEDCQNPYDDIPYHYCTKWLPNDFSKPTIESISRMTYEEVRNLGWKEETVNTIPSEQEHIEQQEQAFTEESLEKKSIEEMDSQPISESH